METGNQPYKSSSLPVKINIHLLILQKYKYSKKFILIA
jgi:hypothetical protein